MPPGTWLEIRSGGWNRRDFVKKKIAIGAGILTALLVAGGAAYLLGLLFYGLGSRHEWMHGVFHLLCLAGSLLH